jgi:hypothetical protein
MKKNIVIIIIITLFLSISIVKAETNDITTDEKLINTLKQLIVLLMQEIDILQKQIVSQQKLLTSATTITTTTTTTKLQICLIGWKCKNPNYKGYQSEDCSWTDLTYCEYGCENGECITPTTPTTTKPSYCDNLCNRPHPSYSPYRIIWYYSKECDCSYYDYDYPGVKP